MNVGELINLLKLFKQDKEVVISSDEELNTLYKEFEVARLDDNEVVIFGLSGTEMEDY